MRNGFFFRIEAIVFGERPNEARRRLSHIRALRIGVGRCQMSAPNLSRLVHRPLPTGVDRPRTRARSRAADGKRISLRHGPKWRRSP